MHLHTLLFEHQLLELEPLAMMGWEGGKVGGILQEGNAPGSQETYLDRYEARDNRASTRQLFA